MKVEQARPQQKPRQLFLKIRNDRNLNQARPQKSQDNYFQKDTNSIQASPKQMTGQENNFFKGTERKPNSRNVTTKDKTGK